MGILVLKVTLIVGFLASVALSCSTLKKAAIQPVKVEGIAMQPALQHGDKIFISRGFDRLERGDIVIFYAPMDQSRSYLKRVIGLPSEVIEIREGNVIINGQQLTERYVRSATNRSLRSFPMLTIPEDCFYVMGDNRDNSADSRMWGPLPRKLIYGKFVSKYSEAPQR